MEGEIARADRDGPGAPPARAARARVRRGLGAVGAATARRRRPSTTTRPTATGCSSTASASPRRSARSARPSPGIDRDVAVTGALLHDIGKLEAYTDDPQQHRPHRRRAPARRDRARLLPHPPRDRGHRGLPARSSRRRSAHIILSHHGSLEHGSPVVPCTREATLVHMIDNLGGRLGSFDRLEKELAPGQRWSSFDRAIGAGRVLRASAAAQRRRPRGRRAAPAPAREAA